MRLLILNHVQNAYQSLRTNRIRSALTMLGVTIGVASVTAILALSGGASNIVNDQINSLGGNIAVIRPKVASDPITNITQPQPNRDFAASTLKESDLPLISQIPHVNAVAPLMKLSGTIRGDSIAPGDSPILATTPQLASISGLKLRDGQFLDGDIEQNVAVVGKQLSINLFGTESSIGKVLTVRGQSFVVVGILANENNPINYNLIDFNNTAIVNMESGKKLNQNVAQIQQIDVRSDSVANLGSEITEIGRVLKANHDGENDFSVLTGDQISRPTSQLFYTIAGVTTAIATISLIVGGIGIMNIMLVTVAERTREIGIRKALGASNRDISWQFLIESLAISVCGGILGYIGGYIIAFSFTSSLEFQPIVNWQIALVALFISLVMGTVFGLYPAIRAASKDPIESLNRHN